MNVIYILSILIYYFIPFKLSFFYIKELLLENIVENSYLSITKITVFFNL